MASAIELRHVTKRFLTPFGTTYTALRDLDLAAQEGEFCAVVGPPGCGNSATIAPADRVVVITSGPGTAKGVYRVDLPRPRNVAVIRFQPEFSRIYQVIGNDLLDEVLLSYERSKRIVS